MEQIEITLKVPKELNDVRILLTELISDIKDKKPTQEIFSENLNYLINAISGMEKISEEVKDDSVYYLASVLAADLIKILKKKDA